MATNNFKLFDENKMNMLNDEEYATAIQRLGGVQTGVASSMLQNKFAYQMSLMAYSLAQMMNANGIDANDTAAVSTFVNNLSSTVLQKVIDKATTAEAQAGISTAKWMTPALVKAFYSYNLATQVEAEAGTDNIKYMSPLRVKQANATMVSELKTKRPNIIRTLPIAAGNTVVAGDVVDAAGGKVQKSFTGNPNIKNLIDVSSSWTSVSKLNDLYSVVAYYMSGSTQCRVSLINNATGENLGGIQLLSGATSYITTARLNDSSFMVGRVYSNALSVILCTVSGTTITQIKSQAISASTTDYNTLTPLSETLFISVYNRAGLKAKVCTVSGATITAGTEYSLPGSTNAAYISATRLPDAANGDKRICVCYSDAGDSNKGKAVIATINASNVVSWGTAVVFEASATGFTSCAENQGNIILFYYLSSTYRFVAKHATSSGNLATIASDFVNITDTSGGGYATAIAIKDGFALSYNGGTDKGASLYASIEESVLKTGSKFIFNTSAVNYLASTPLSDGKFVAVYSDSGNSNYGTATLLTVRGNQVAGSFTDVSSQAIALQSGTAGQSIDIIFDGVAELTGITVGTQITSAGVQGYAPQDGWLWVRPAWESSYDTKFVYGSYTGNNGSTERSFSLGFRPKMLYVFGLLYTSTDVPALALVWPEAQVTVRSGGMYVEVDSAYFEITDDGFKRLPFAGGATAWNQSGKVYKYFAVK